MGSVSRLMCASAVVAVAMTAGCTPPFPYPGVARLCDAADGLICECSGTLIAPDILLSANHCAPQPWAIFGRTDPTDTSTGVAIRLDDRCQLGRIAFDPDCTRLNEFSDLELYRLREPVDPSVTVPLRLGTEADRTDVRLEASDFIAVGYGGGVLEGFPLARPRPCPSHMETVVNGADLCIEGTEPPNGHSGGPLLARMVDGEFAVVGITSRIQAGYSIFQDMADFFDEVPAITRPAAHIDAEDDTSFLFPWGSTCTTSITHAPQVRTDSLVVGDFTGDGDADAFYELSTGDPRVLVGPTLTEITTDGVVTLDSFFGFTYAAGDFEPGGPAEIAAINDDGRLRVLALSGTTWLPTVFPDIVLTDHDPLWGGSLSEAFLDDDFRPFTDRLLRVGDFRGDGQSDLLGVFQDNLVIFDSVDGSFWTIRVHSLASLSIPNAQAYRESIMLADVAPGIAGDEVVARDACGLVVFGYDGGTGLFEIHRDPCLAESIVPSDAAGYDTNRRWLMGAGELNGDGCDDIVIRSQSQVHQLLSNCDALTRLSFLEGRATGAYWQQPFYTFDGWGGVEGSGRMFLSDINGDGLDDLVGNGPDGLVARINTNASPMVRPFDSAGGLFSATTVTGAVQPRTPIEDWRSVRAFDAGGLGQQLLSLSVTQGCWELVGI